MAQVQRERFEEFALDVYGDLAHIDGSKVDWEFFDSPAGAHFFLEVVQRAVRTERGEKQLAVLRNAFVNGVTFAWSKSPLRDVFVRLAGDLSPDQVRLLGIISRGLRPRRPGEDMRTSDEAGLNATYFITLDEIFTQGPGLDPLELQVLLIDLRRLELVGNWWAGTAAALNPLNERWDRITLTQPGRYLALFLTDPSQQ